MKVDGPKTSDFHDRLRSNQPSTSAVNSIYGIKEKTRMILGPREFQRARPHAQKRQWLGHENGVEYPIAQEQRGGRDFSDHGI